MKKSKLKKKYKKLIKKCEFLKGEYECYKSRFYEEAGENKRLYNRLKLVTDLIAGE